MGNETSAAKVSQDSEIWNQEIERKEEQIQNLKKQIVVEEKYFKEEMDKYEAALESAGEEVTRLNTEMEKLQEEKESANQEIMKMQSAHENSFKVRQNDQTDIVEDLQ